MTGRAIHNQIALTGLDECVQIHTPYIFLLIPRPLLEYELSRMTFILSDSAPPMPQSWDGLANPKLAALDASRSPKHLLREKGRGGSERDVMSQTIWAVTHAVWVMLPGNPPPAPYISM